MTIYYTAKDIEELAAQGIRQLEIGPGVTLTDFARETAQQLDIDLVDRRQAELPAPTQPAAPTQLRQAAAINITNRRAANMGQVPFRQRILGQ